MHDDRATPGASPRCRVDEHQAHRREFMHGMLGGVFSGLFGATAATLSFNLPGGFSSGSSNLFSNGGGSAAAVGAEPDAAGDAAKQLRSADKRVLFIWLAGGSSQFETWDPKPGRETGGPFRAIQTSVPGHSVCELMPKLAQRVGRLAVVRSLSTGQSEHGQAADLISTGWPKEPSLDHPEIGVILAKELALRDSELPDYVSLFTTSEGRRRPNTGFLGGRHAPVLLEESIRPKNATLPDGMTAEQHERREQLRRLVGGEFAKNRAGGDQARSYDATYEKVRGLMRSDHLFDLDREPQSQRDAYGSSPYGRHCLLARRLLEAGVPMVKIARGFWDSHHDNFESHRELVPDFDHVTSVLLDDLGQRGLLDHTLVVVLSEFGRTPKINQDVGRDHYADAWSFVMAGCGVRGGTIYGKTSEDGTTVVDGKANAGDIAATIFQAVGLDPAHHYQVGARPVPRAKEDARPIAAVLS